MASPPTPILKANISTARFKGSLITILPSLNNRLSRLLTYLSPLLRRDPPIHISTAIRPLRVHRKYFPILINFNLNWLVLLISWIEFLNWLNLMLSKVILLKKRHRWGSVAFLFVVLERGGYCKFCIDIFVSIAVYQKCETRFSRRFLWPF